MRTRVNDLGNRHNAYYLLAIVCMCVSFCAHATKLHVLRCREETEYIFYFIRHVDTATRRWTIVRFSADLVKNARMHFSPKCFLFTRDVSTVFSWHTNTHTHTHAHTIFTQKLTFTICSWSYCDELGIYIVAENENRDLLYFYRTREIDLSFF